MLFPSVRKFISLLTEIYARPYANFDVLFVLIQSHFRNAEGQIAGVQTGFRRRATREELVNLLPHKWKLQHPESVSTKQNEESGN